MPLVDEEELKEAFSLFDKDNSGRIPSKELGNIMRALGANPNPDEVKQLISEFDSSGGQGTIGYGDFRTIMNRVMKDEFDPKEVAMAFRVFDRDGKGTLSVDEMHSIFAHLGEVRLSSEEIEELIKEGRPDTRGHIDYNALARIMCQQ